jgi:hypothetical protein
LRKLLIAAAFIALPVASYAQVPGQRSGHLWLMEDQNNGLIAFDLNNGMVRSLLQQAMRGQISVQQFVSQGVAFDPHAYQRCSEVGQMTSMGYNPGAVGVDHDCPR